MKKRVTIWVDADKYAKLKAKLALLGKTITKWFEELLEREIDETK